MFPHMGSPPRWHEGLIIMEMSPTASSPGMPGWRSNRTQGCPARIGFRITPLNHSSVGNKPWSFPHQTIILKIYLTWPQNKVRHGKKIFLIINSENNNGPAKLVYEVELSLFSMEEDINVQNICKNSQPHKVMIKRIIKKCQEVN